MVTEKTGIDDSAVSGLFYLQDSRGFVGNDMQFWRKHGNGYTTDLSQAEIYTKEEAEAMHRNRETDIPWPKEYIDARTRPAVDMQYVDIKIALQGTDIVLIKQKKEKATTYRCHSCGIFLRAGDYYSSAGCHKCNGDNRP